MRGVLELNIRHVVGKLIGQVFFYPGELGASRNVSGKLGMKLAILYDDWYFRSIPHIDNRMDVVFFVVECRLVYI